MGDVEDRGDDALHSDQVTRFETGEEASSCRTVSEVVGESLAALLVLAALMLRVQCLSDVQVLGGDCSVVALDVLARSAAHVHDQKVCT